MDEKIIVNILRIFAAKGIRPGEVLKKSDLMGEMRNWPAEEKLRVRDAWHLLVGNELIREGHPDGPALTERGQQFLDQRAK